jgi:hypothetical protein
MEFTKGVRARVKVRVETAEGNILGGRGRRKKRHHRQNGRQRRRKRWEGEE